MTEEYTSLMAGMYVFTENQVSVTVCLFFVVSDILWLFFWSVTHRG